MHQRNTVYDVRFTNRKQTQDTGYRIPDVGYTIYDVLFTYSTYSLRTAEAVGRWKTGAVGEDGQVIDDPRYDALHLLCDALSAVRLRDLSTFSIKEHSYFILHV